MAGLGLVNNLAFLKAEDAISTSDATSPLLAFIDPQSQLGVHPRLIIGRAASVESGSVDDALASA
jgi:hypothetical protein